MSNKSSSMKKKGGNSITKKMITGRMDDMANLMVAMEATMMEWEVWYRIVKMQQISLKRGEITQDQLDFFINDGPIFTDLTGKIMASIRSQIPDYAKEKQDSPVDSGKPAILGADGFAAQKETKPLIK
jgi:hypothetical protein